MNDSQTLGRVLSPTGSFSPSRPGTNSLIAADHGTTLSPSRLAAIDLDDTLFGRDKKVSSANREALERLRAAGYEIIVASGRHHRNILSYEQQIGPLGWTISSQGAVVQHSGTDELLHEWTVPEATALALYDLGRQMGCSLLVYHRDGVFAEEESEWTRLYASRAGWQPQIADLSRLAADGVQKVFFSHSGERIAQIAPEMERLHGKTLYLVVTDPETLEFLSPRANKGSAARVLARKLGVARENVVAFGDGNNDVELLSWAGASVAMAHGRPSARQAARLISPAGAPETAFARGVDLVLSEA